MNKLRFFWKKHFGFQIPLPIWDFWQTRRRPLTILAAPIGAFAVFILYNCILTKELFTNFLNIQINIIAILLSFSTASVAIIVSSDSDIISNLRSTFTKDDNKYREIQGKKLSLFQILLSNITYNIEIEVIYLASLLTQNLCQIDNQIVIKYIMATDIFFIVHILCILMTTVTQLYLTFWRNINKSELTPKDEK